MSLFDKFNIFSSEEEKPRGEIATKGKSRSMAGEAPDVEELVRAWAWQMFDMTKTKEHARLSRESLLMHVNWKKVRFTHGEPEYEDKVKPETPKSQCLFKTYFTNNTDQDQEYSFKTERATRSVCDVAIEKGFTIGEEMSVKLATPCEVFEANAGFHRELSLNSATGQSFEEELVWSVDSNIKVKPMHKTTAELQIAEDQYFGKFKVKTMFSGKVHVTITNIKDNNSFVKAIDGNIAEIIRRESDNGLKGFVIEKNNVSFTTQGQCNFRYAIQQHVVLHQEPIESTAGMSGYQLPNLSNHNSSRPKP